MSINTERKEVYNTAYGITTVSFQYPEHYTQQQTGFTPAGGSKNHFPGVTTKRLSKVHSIAHNNVLIAEAERIINNRINGR
jgi:hypothetical protein